MSKKSFQKRCLCFISPRFYRKTCFLKNPY